MLFKESDVTRQRTTSTTIWSTVNFSPTALTFLPLLLLLQKCLVLQANLIRKRKHPSRHPWFHSGIRAATPQTIQHNIANVSRERECKKENAWKCTKSASLKKSSLMITRKIKLIIIRGRIYIFIEHFSYWWQLKLLYGQVIKLNSNGRNYEYYFKVILDNDTDQNKTDEYQRRAELKRCF